MKRPSTLGTCSAKSCMRWYPSWLCCVRYKALSISGVCLGTALPLRTEGTTAQWICCVWKNYLVWDGKSSNLHGREHLKLNTSSGKTRVGVWGSNSKFGWTRDHRSHRCSSSQSSNTTSDQRANGEAKTVTSQQSPTQKRESNTVKHLMESGSWIYDENWAGWLAISHESRSKHP